MNIDRYDADVKLLHTPNSIRTIGGRYLDAMNPKPGQISIGDIAFGLSRVCRFAGHTRKFYSVAQHSCDVCDMVPDSLKLQALLHDASEAYIGDLPSPIKQLLPDYQVLEQRIMEAIAKKFNFPWPLHPMVKNADTFYLEYEWVQGVLNNRLDAWPEPRAISEFIERFKQYWKGGGQ